MVHCVACGFLVLRELTSRRLLEANDEFRDVGAPKAGQNVEVLAYCFRMKANLGKDIAEYDSQGRDKKILGVINTERRCDGFEEWRPNFSPREHMDMVLQREQREWQERRDNEMRNWQERQQRSDRGFRLWLVVIGGLLVLLSSMITALYQVFILG